LSAAFAGFGPAVTDWFAGLASDNSRTYWAATRDIWQRDIRGPLEALLAELAAEVGGGVKLFRPYRDVRFGGAEAPLKTAAGGLLLPAAGSAAARYVEVSAAGFYAGTGYHRLERDQLAAYRRAVAGEAGVDLEAALADARVAGLEVGGEVLTGTPQGVARDHPRIGLLRRKGVFVGASLPPGDPLETRAPLDHARRVWGAAAPVVAWLDAHVGESAEAAVDRPERRRVRG
jgi:uncharacterized protein (TIGR02453 family)